MKVNAIDLIDFKKIGFLLDGFKKVTGLATAILDLEGNILSHSEWRKLCVDFYQKKPETANWCATVKIELAEKIAQGGNFHFYKNENGLIEVAIPIYIEDTHFANLFSGLFFSEPKNPTVFENERVKYDFDKKTYNEALSFIPVISLEKIKNTMDFLLETVQFIIEMAFQKAEKIELDNSLTINKLLVEGIIDNSPALIYVADTEGRFKLINKEFQKKFNLPKADLVEKFRHEIMPHEIAQQHRNNDLHVLQLEQSIVIEEDNIETDGKHHYISQKFPLYDSNGTVYAVGGISTDITDKIRIKEALLVSENKYESLFNNSADGILVLNEQSEILELNNRICEILEYDREDLQLLKVYEIIHSEDLASKDHEAALKQLLDGKTLVTKYRLRKKNGTYISTELNTKMITEGIFLNIIRDITERELDEKTTLESEVKYRFFFENSMDAMLLTENNGLIISANAAACTLFGYTEDEITKLNKSQITDMTDPRFALLGSTRNDKGKVRGEITLLHKSGKHIETEISTAVFENTDNTKFISIIIRDVTERKKAEKSLQEREEVLSVIFNNHTDLQLLVSVENDDEFQINAINNPYISTAANFGIAINNNEIIGKPLRNLFDILGITNETYKTTVSKYKEAANTGKPVRYTESIDVLGLIYTSEITLNPVMREDGKCQYILYNSRNISEQTRANIALKKSEKILSVIFNNHTDLQVLVSVHDNYEFRLDAMNKQYIDTATHLGITIDPKAVIGKSVRVLNEALGFDEEYYNAAYAKYKKVVDTKTLHSYTENLNILGRIYSSEVTLNPVVNENGDCQYILFNSHNITEQKRTTNALKESEDKFKEIFLTSPDYVTITKVEDGTYVDVNDAFTQISGYTREQIIGSTASELNVWKTPEDRITMIEKLNKYGKIQNFEAQITLQNGQIIDGLLSATSLTINNKPHILTITRDITELKQAERAFKETAANLRSMIDNREDSIYSIDLDFKYIIFNSTFEKIINNQYNIKLKKGMSSLENLTEEERNFWVPKFKSTFEGKSEEFEFTFTINGENHYFQTTLNPIFEDNIVIGTSGISSNITKRKLIEEALKLSEEKFEKTFRLSPYMVSLSTMEGNVVEVNDRVFTTLGYTREEFLNKDTTLLPIWVNPEERISFAELLKKDQNLHEMEVNFRKKTGEIGSYLLSACIIEINDKKLFLSIIHDITLRKNTEKLIQNLNIELETKVKQRTEQLETINKELETFTYSVSHDLKAPLRGIDGYSKLLSDIYKNDLNQEAQSFIDKIRVSTQQMNQIIEDLLDYSRLERSQLNIGSIKIKDLIETVLSLYSEELEAGYFIIDKNITDTQIIADSKGFIIAFRNLIENAIKFTKGEQKPIIIIKMEESEFSWIISVNDNGIGFDMKYHHKIFDIFQRLQRAEDFPGTGIGLALVSKAMQRMNGKTWAESIPDEGATFYLEIPKKQ